MPLSIEEQLKLAKGEVSITMPLIEWYMIGKVLANEELTDGENRIFNAAKIKFAEQIRGGVPSIFAN
jgi:hypothetical protein